MSHDMLMEEKNVNKKILNGISNAHSILKKIIKDLSMPK